MKLVELCERDVEFFRACEILNGGKVSELAEGDVTAFRPCAEYYVAVAKKMTFGDGDGGLGDVVGDADMAAYVPIF